MPSERTLTRLAPGKMFAGKFRLEQNFASGGMGSMWRARDTQRDIPVAIKVMSATVADSPGFIVRFQREAKAAAQIGSPHVVSIYEFGVHNELPYIVMELLEGEDLQSRLKREHRLSPRTTARIVRGMCEALHGAHEVGIVHRDLKPANVFLVRERNTQIVKVLDFGIAKLTQDEDGHITATGQMIGTPHYMSPEQIQGAKHVDHRADLWAVSAIAFRMLTGQLPFPGHTVQAIRAILYDSAPPPSKLAPELPPAVDAYFAKALARDINARFQGARELSDELVKAIGREAMRRPEGDSDELTPSGVHLADILHGGPTSLSQPPPESTRSEEAADSRDESDADDQQPEAPSTLRPPVPLDAPLLPVQLPQRDSVPSSPSFKDAAKDSTRSAPSSRSRPSASSSVPSSQPIVPAARGRSWMVWAAAAAFLLAALVAVIATVK